MEAVPATAHPAWIAPVPNALTFSRLGLAVAWPFLPHPLRLPAVVAAAVTDGLDGWIARRFGAASELGRLLDGVADKAFALSVGLTLTLEGTVRPWEGPLVLARDLVVAGIAAWAAATHGKAGLRHMRVRAAGKATTFFAFAWFATVLVPAPEPWRVAAFVLAAAVSVAAAVDYLRQAVLVTRRG
jgi:phosphatidylglycerophosphate synthase